MSIKKINKIGNVCIPKRIRQCLPSDKVKIYMTVINGKDVVVLEPVGQNKHAHTIYE